MNKRERAQLEKKVQELHQTNVVERCGTCTTLTPLDQQHCQLRAFVLTEHNRSLYSEFFVNACMNYSERCPNVAIAAIVAEICKLLGKDN